MDLNLVPAALQRLAKWRTVFTGWQLGTRADTDPQAQAVRDHREATIMLRAEVTALVYLMVEKDVFTHEEFVRQIGDEAEHLMRAFEKLFPGFKAADYGMDIDVVKAAETTKHWRP
jgi:hypothetical protein